MSSGEDKAWKILRGLHPEDVCKNAAVEYDHATGMYLLKSFGMDIYVDKHNERIYSDAPDADLLLGRLGYFSILSILFYLTSAKDIPLSGKLLQPVNLKGGHIFFRGTHVLPLEKLASKYGNDADGFLKRGRELGGKELNYGDAAVQLFPFPRIPVVIILWREDEEFPPRMDILFDSTCEFHLALDILWSIAMKSLLIMMC
ncbi:MAG: DUF3786 domain-containing protein [Nitrospirota bacterium]|nr:DUF3786 domain-containing protein [Nitrospirota bacterium]